MDFTEILSNVWTWIAGIAGTVSIGTLIGFFTALINSAKQRKIAKAYYDSVEKLVGETTSEGIKQVKSISFSHDIQPLVESKLQKVYEYSVKVVEKELALVKSQYAHLVSVVEALAKYFDNSIGVSEEAKEGLKKALEEAKESVAETQPVESKAVVEEPKSSAKEEKVAETKASR